jgi:hypothetical protein
MNTPENASYPDDSEYKIENEKINEYLLEIQNIIKKTYGITEFSTTESIKIKHIIKHYLTEQEKYNPSIIKKGIDVGGNLTLIFDVIATWFSDEFDINIENIPKVFIITDPLSGKSTKFEQTEKNKAIAFANSVKEDLKKRKSKFNSPIEYNKMLDSVLKIIEDDPTVYIVTDPLSGQSTKFEQTEKNNAIELADNIKEDIRERKSKFDSPAEYYRMLSSVLKIDVLDEKFAGYINSIKEGDVVFKRDFDL